MRANLAPLPLYRGDVFKVHRGSLNRKSGFMEGFKFAEDPIITCRIWGHDSWCTLANTLVLLSFSSNNSHSKNLPPSRVNKARVPHPYLHSAVDAGLDDVKLICTFQGKFCPFKPSYSCQVFHCSARKT
ncbi:MAG: hypothetical protein ACFFCS_26755 [Candidatus Hodarchaeota archaeon]